MKKPKSEKPKVKPKAPADSFKGDVKPTRYERPAQRPKPTPKPPKKK